MPTTDCSKRVEHGGVLVGDPVAQLHGRQSAAARAIGAGRRADRDGCEPLRRAARRRCRPPAGPPPRCLPPGDRGRDGARWLPALDARRPRRDQRLRAAARPPTSKRSAPGWPSSTADQAQRRPVELLERLPVAGRGGLVVGRVVGDGEAVRGGVGDQRVVDAGVGERGRQPLELLVVERARRSRRRRRRPSPSSRRPAGAGCRAPCWRSGRRGTTPPRRRGRGSARRR